MRVTNQSMSTRLLSSIQTAQSRLSDTQDRVASGRRINRPSDDPFGTSRSIAAHASIDLIAQYQRTITLARSELGSTESVLTSLGDVIQRARELAVQADSSSIDGAGRRQIAAEVNQLLSEAIKLGNTSYAGRHIFAGQQTQTAPFVEDVPGQPATVTYQGDVGQVQREIGEGDQVAVNLDGDEIFTPVFQDLIAFRDALNTNDMNGVSAASGNMGTNLDTVLQARGEIGARTRRLDLADTRLGDVTLQLQTSISSIEDADMSQEVVDLQTRETALQAALAATGRSLTTSLLDFLR
ncbi:MAG: flagellar hook-associated protein FlgL [Dehalococcoidia bacterium]